MELDLFPCCCRCCCILWVLNHSQRSQVQANRPIICLIVNSSPGTLGFEVGNRPHYVEHPRRHVAIRIMSYLAKIEISLAGRQVFGEIHHKRLGDYAAFSTFSKCETWEYPPSSIFLISYLRLSNLRRKVSFFRLSWVSIWDWCLFIWPLLNLPLKNQQKDPWRR